MDQMEETEDLAEECLTPRQQRDVRANRMRIYRGLTPMNFALLAERVVAELERRGRYLWQSRESLQEALGMTREEMTAALSRLVDEYRIEKMPTRPRYRLNNARRVQAAR